MLCLLTPPAGADREPRHGPRSDAAGAVPVRPARRPVLPGHTKDADGIVRKRELSKEWPDWAPNQYPEDKFLLLASQTTPDLEYDHKQCFVYLHEKKPILCVLIERAPKNVLKRVALPACIVVSIALAVSGIEEGDFNDEFGAQRSPHCSP